MNPIGHGGDGPPTGEPGGPGNPLDPKIPLPSPGIPTPGMHAQPGDPEAAPTVIPEPAPTEVDPTETAAQKLKRLRALRQGLISTIKTSPAGTATPPLVAAPGLYSTGTKGKLGQ